METETPVLSFSSFDENWFTFDDFTLTVESDISFKLSFDYETMIKTKKSFLYLYIELDNEKSTIQTRTCFEYTPINGLSDHIFTVEQLEPCIRLAVDKTVIKMNRECKYFGYKKGFSMDTNLIQYESLAQDIADKYHHYRKLDDLSNQKEINTLCMECPRTDVNKVVFIGTFIILERSSSILFSTMRRTVRFSKNVCLMPNT